MVWCSNCAKVQPAQPVRSSLICCEGCGKVVHQKIDSKKRSICGVTVGEHEQGINSSNAGKSHKFNVAAFKALRTTVSKNSKGAICSTEDSESLSDIDDTEVKSYLLKEEEHLIKKMMWERLNLEYAKADTAIKAAIELGKERKRTEATERKKARDTGKTAVKKTSERVNSDVLKNLLGESEGSENPKKRRTGSCSENDTVREDSESGQNMFSAWGVMDENDDEETDLKCGNDPYDDYEGQGYNDYGDDFF